MFKSLQVDISPLLATLILRFNGATDAQAGKRRATVLRGLSDLTQLSLAVGRRSLLMGTQTQSTFFYHAQYGSDHLEHSRWSLLLGELGH